MTDTLNSPTATASGRGWAYTFTVLGGAVSIAANIAHSYVPPAGAPTDWVPKPGAVIGAIVWPVFLFGAVELLARVAWPDGLRWQLLRFGGMTPVAVVAALVSYRHLSGLLGYYGEEPVVCVLGPLAVDGLMVMATGAILATGQHTNTRTTAHTTESTTEPTTENPTKHPTQYPTQYTTSHASVSAAAGTGASRVDLPATLPTPPSSTTTATSTGSNTTPDTTNPTPATTLNPTSNTTGNPAAAGDPAPMPDNTRPEIPTPADLAARNTLSTTSTPTRPAARPRSAARPPRPRPSTAAPSADKLARPAADTRVTEPDAAQLALPIVPPDVLRRADQTARQHRTEHGTPITPGQLAARLKINSEQAAQALAVLNLAPDSPTTPNPTVNGTPVKTTR